MIFSEGTARQLDEYTLAPVRFQLNPSSEVRFPLSVAGQQQRPGALYANLRHNLGGDMKKLVTCAVAITGFIGTSAFAADMGVPAAPPPAPVWNWTGWYAGVNLGASFGSVNTDFNAFPVTTGFGLPPFGLGVPVSDRTSPDGFMGGGQIGYNWQYSPLIVVGFEADFQGAIEKDTSNLNNPFSVIVTDNMGATFPVTGTLVTNYTTEIDWFGTVRARIGYVWGNGNVLSYVTGGLAYGEVKINGTSAVSGIEGVNPFGPASQTFGHSQVNTGWVVGYGTEGRLGISNWTWKIEGLWMDLGTLDATGPGGTAHNISGASPFSTTTGPFATHSHFTDGILRGGLNYKFY
jgi:outer membrane immunogenic protein